MNGSHERLISEVNKALIALILGAAAIGISPIWLRLTEVGPTASAFHRVFLALPLLWGWMWIEDSHPANAPRIAPTHKDRLKLLLAGLFFAGDLAFWHWSVELTSVANATLLANCAPIFVTLGSFLIFGSRVSRLFLVGLTMTISGAVVLLGDSLGAGPSSLLGDTLGVCTALFYGAYILAVGRLRARFTTAQTMAWTGVGTTLGLFIVVLVSGESLIAPSLGDWGILLGLAWISHSGGQGLIAYALAHLPVQFSSVGLLLQPVIAAVLAWVVLGEAIGAWQATGAVIILIGIYVARIASRT